MRITEKSVQKVDFRVSLPESWTGLVWSRRDQEVVVLTITLARCMLNAGGSRHTIRDPVGISSQMGLLEYHFLKAITSVTK